MPVKSKINTFDENISRILAATESALLAGMLLIERKVVKYFEKEKINVTGYLRNSITSEVRREAYRILGITGTNMKYAIFVHEGTRPHWPPVDPIRKWVVQKLGIRGKEVSNVTFLVRRKISKVGTKGRPFFGFVFRQYQNQIARIVADRMKMKLV